MTIKVSDLIQITKVIDLYEHTGWCISLDGVNPYDLLDSEICQGCIIYIISSQIIGVPEPMQSA